MSASTKPPIGHFANERLTAKKRAVAKSRNAGGQAAIYGEVAREVLSEYPNITAEEKASVFGHLKGDAELTAMRTRTDMSTALQELSRIFGVN